MAKRTTRDAVITLSAVDYSTQISGATLNISVDELDTTCFQDAAHRREAGLKDGTVSFTLKPNADLTNFNTIADLVGTVTAFTYKVDDASNSATNPEAQANALWTSIDFNATVDGLLAPTLNGSLDTVVTWATS